MKKFSLLAVCSLLMAATLTAQNVGINTTNPIEKLHINNGNLLISGPSFVGDAPAVIGGLAAGTKFLWINNRAALRAGRQFINEWGEDSIGAYSIAFGSNVNVFGNAGAAFGAGNRVGYYGFAAGYKNLALGDAAVGIGENNRIEGRGGSMAVGENNISKSYAATVVGRYNDTTGMNSPASPSSTNPLFIVGNGTANDQRSNALVVRANGNVGIGVPAPFATLDIMGPSSQQQLRLRSTTNDFVRIRMFNAVNTLPYWDIASITHASQSASAYMNFFYSQSGNTGLNVLSLQGNGNAILAGTLTQNSDARLKKDITRIEDPMDAISQVSGYHYQWKDEARETGTQTGLLAQEVEKVMPELVKTDDKGVKSVNYNGLIPYMLEALKAQQSTIAGQQQQIEVLKTLVEQLMKK